MNTNFKTEENVKSEEIQETEETEETEEHQKTFEELYEGMSDTSIYHAIIEKEDEEKTFEELCYELSYTMNNEKTRGRSWAIESLVNNEYEILQDEYGNPFKELINFTLLYFANDEFSNNVDLKNNIESFFPIMNQYIIRKIKSMNPNLMVTFNEIDNNLLFDEQKAYDEFINFVAEIFKKNYKDKTERDMALRNNFKILGDDMISYIGSGSESK